MKRLVLGAILATMAPMVSAATIVNGSFEQTSLTGAAGFTTLSAGNSAVSGWTVSTGTIDYIRTAWKSSAGANSVELNGTGAGSISQLITGLLEGRSYEVYFDLSANPLGGNASKLLAVSAGQDSRVYTVKGTGKTTTNMGWTQKLFTFTALGVSELLTFRSMSAGAYGAAIDNVSLKLQPIPIPASALLVLTALGGLALMKRRKQA